MEPWERPQAIADYDAAISSGRPYFGPVYQADQGSDYFKYFAPIVRLVRRSDHTIRILEVGSWAGASLLAWDQASDHNVLLVAVDNWRPYLPSGHSLYNMMNHAIKSGEIERLFWHNVQSIGHERLRVHVGDSRVVLKNMNMDFDVVFIDGDHRYEFVRSDIDQAMRLVRNGGVICGDDLEKQISELNWGDHCDALAKNTDAVNDYHPGVTQAVWECFGNITRRDGGFWAVQKIGDEWSSIAL